MLFDLIKRLFPKTYQDIYNLGMNHGVSEERSRAFEERAKIRRFEQEEWVDKKVIIISNEWEDPFVGTVVGLDQHHSGSSLPVAQNAITHEMVLCFGKIIPFSVEGLKALVQMSPWVRWEILTGQKITMNPPNDPTLKTFDQLMEQLDENGFFGVEVADMLEDAINGNN